MHCMWYWSFHSSKSAIFNIQILGNFGKSTQTWWMVWNNWCYVGYKLYCHPKEERLCESVQEPVYWKRSGSNLLSLAFRVHPPAGDAGANENSNPPLLKLLHTLDWLRVHFEMFTSYARWSCQDSWHHCPRIRPSLVKKMQTMDFIQNDLLMKENYHLWGLWEVLFGKLFMVSAGNKLK